MTLEYYYFPIGLAVLFLIHGLILYKKRELWEANDRKKYNWRIAVPIISIAMSCAVILAMVLFSPSASRRETFIKETMHCSAANVDEIILNPISSGISLTAVPISIYDRMQIAEIMNALNSAATFSPNHPIEKWSTIITVKTNGLQRSFIVLQASDTTNGTLFLLKSNLTDGWTIGTFRADTLGPVLDRIVLAQQRGR